MRGFRVHQVNSKYKRFALSILTIATFRCVVSPCLAQQDNVGVTRSYPNPFRPDRSSESNRDKFNERQPNESQPNESQSVNVIRLSKLPLHNDYPVVTAVSVSPNGNLLAAAGDDHAIRIISFETGKTISTLVGHLDWVQCVEFSPSGRQLASCGHDGTLCVWSMNETPKLIVENSVGHALLTLSFLNEDRIYTAGFGNNIYRWNSTDRQLIIDHACDCRDIRSITCSRDKTMVAYGGRDGVLRIRSTDDSNSTDPNHSNHSNEIMAPLHFDRIRSIQFSDDSTQITSVGEDRRIVHYDILKRVAIGQTEIGGGKLMGLCQLDNHLFAIAGSDNSIRIFSDVDKRVLVKLVGHDGSVGVLRRTASHIISGSFDTTIRVWDIDRALSRGDTQGRYVHPVAAQFEDSGAGDRVK